MDCCLVPRAELIDLLYRDMVLTILEMDGVENWGYYMNSRDKYIKDMIEGDLKNFPEGESTTLFEIAQILVKDYN